ncbi:inositol monophosphatase [Microbacterium faecale]|uniref:Inositol monophosphatase n=1 Tax=Microbacterium faecale TaxID=1804630 RepID=A0A916Y7L6_9MICO|nr:inositol monophosphatase family protein [Microbacterium faecale]GGD33644.1 inositol monophosphatase [Microbacterium faecale]
MSGTLAEELLVIARGAARAGALILDDSVGAHVSVTAKSELGDVVTDVDRRAERTIRSYINARRPDDAITGEEYDATGDGAATYRWSIDPLDGTSNFVAGIPYFGSSVAVQETASGSWVAGAVNAPALRQEYYARAGAGAWLTSRGSTVNLAGADTSSGAILFGTGFSYSREMRARQFTDLPLYMEHFTDVRSVGSAALGLCMAAEGSTSAFVETDLYEFDWAAGALIAEEAGLTVVRPRSHRGGIWAHSPHVPLTILDAPHVG